MVPWLLVHWWVWVPEIFFIGGWIVAVDDGMCFWRKCIVTLCLIVLSLENAIYVGR